jgi:hypothetical protein
MSTQYSPLTNVLDTCVNASGKILKSTQSYLHIKWLELINVPRIWDFWAIFPLPSI